MVLVDVVLTVTAAAVVVIAAYAVVVARLAVDVAMELNAAETDPANAADVAASTKVAGGPSFVKL